MSDREETRWERQKRERDAFADQLAAEYASVLPKHVADRAFALAWEHGHANGEGEVENYYIDFTDLAGDAYRAGLAGEAKTPAREVKIVVGGRRVKMGDRVRLWIGPPKRGAYRCGEVIGVDNLSHLRPGVQIRLDQPFNGQETCYATHDEVELLETGDRDD